MKKVGILTYHRAINYGAFLQCYSLYKFITENFKNVSVEIIDYEPLPEFIIRIKQYLNSKTIAKLVGHYKMVKAFDKDRSHLIKLSKKRIIGVNSKILGRRIRNDYDIIIVGSDAVWNDFIKPSKKAFFLDESINCIKMSYAASTNGLDTKMLNSINKHYLYNTLSLFSYIGVREQKGVKFVSSISSKLTAYRNCDPTCFLNLEDISDSSISKLQKYGLSMDKPIICLMTSNETVGKHVYEAFHEKYQILSIYSYNKYSDVILYDLSPLEFAVIFKHVKLLFSFFFHGAYLCLKNGTPVMAVDEDKEPDGDITKIEFLFNLLGIKDWYYRPQEMDTAQYSLMIDKATQLLGGFDKSCLMKKIEKESQNKNSFFEAFSKIVSQDETNENE